MQSLFKQLNVARETRPMPDRRYRRALDIVSAAFEDGDGSHLRFTPKDDAHVRKYTKFLRQLRRVEVGAAALATMTNKRRASEARRRCRRQLHKLIDVYPTEMLIHDAYIARSFTAHSIECLLLARVPVDQIADKSDLDAGAVELYERMFFDITSFIDKELAIYERVLNRSMMHGLSFEDKDQLWKAVAYHFGAAVLVGLWDPGPMTPQAMQVVQEVLQSSVVRNAALAALTRSPNNFNASEVVSDYVNVMKSGEDFSPEDEADDAAKMLLSAVAVSVASTEQAAPLPVEGRTGLPIQRLLQSRGNADGSRQSPDMQPVTQAKLTPEEQRKLSKAEVGKARRALSKRVARK